MTEDGYEGGKTEEVKGERNHYEVIGDCMSEIKKDWLLFCY